MRIRWVGRLALRFGIVALAVVALGTLPGCDLLSGVLRIGSLVKVVGTGPLGLHVRDVAAGDILSTVPDGWVFEILGGPEMAQLGGTTYKWWQVRDEQYDSPGLIGWVAERYLGQASGISLRPRNEKRYFSDAQAPVLAAIDRVNDYIDDETEWYDEREGVYLCLRFVRQSFAGAPIPGWLSARAALDALDARGLFYPAGESWNPPIGALVFFESNSSPQYDHVGVFLGSRQVAHVEGDRKAHVRDLGEIVQYSYIDGYLGWAYPPEEWLEQDDSLVAYYDFDQAVMTTLLDNSQYLNAGDIQQIAGVVPGKVGNAFSFDGVNDWIKVPDSESLRSIQQFTISCWVKPASLPPMGRAPSTGIVAYGEGWQGMWELRLMGDGALFLLLNWNTPSETDVVSSAHVSVGTWHFVVATFDGETARLYVDGRLEAEKACSELVHSGENSYMAIGLNFPGGHEYFHGLIDELRIYNKAIAP